ncbi:MAG: hypothetical protein J2P46_10315 [Zavarzinella sp.]|nr:hypothetical protein [Zavarzinella sp.]
MGNENRFDTIVGRQLRQARAAGIHPPVLATLSSDARPARAAFAGHYGGRLKPRGKDWVRGVGQIVTWSVADAIRLLRRHAGLGGNLVANLLDDSPETVDTWSLDWGRALSVSGFRDEDLVLTSCALYDDLPFAVCDCCAAKHGPGNEHMPSAGNDRGAAHEALVRSAALVGIVTARVMPAVDYPVPETVDLPVRDDELAHILQAYYVDSPVLVINVLTALRKAHADGHRWLAGVLNDRPELGNLARRVRVGGGGVDTARTPDGGNDAETSGVEDNPKTVF